MARSRVTYGNFIGPRTRAVWRFCRWQLLSLALAAVLFTAQPSATAQSIDEALAYFYVNSPTLKATQLEVSSNNESFNQTSGAKSPQVTLSVTPSVDRTYSYPCPGSSAACPVPTNSGAVGLGLGVTQKVDLSGAIGAELRRAEATQRLNWFGYYVQEQGLMLEAVNAYMAVITSRAAESLNRASVEVFSRRRDEAQQRFDSGLGTRAEVANFEASLQGEQARLRLAVGNSEIAEAEFRRIFDIDPAGLAFPASIANMPRTLDEAIDRAMLGDPALSQAEQALSEAELEIAVQRGKNGPSMSLLGSVNHNQDLLRNSGDYTTTFRVGAQVDMPLYQGGAGVSRVRQAEIDRKTKQAQLWAQREQTRANVISAWNNLQAQEASLDSFVSQITAAELAARSAAEELAAGLGTALAVLTAEKDLTSAQVNLLSTRSAQVVASYALLQAMGDLMAEKMQLPVDGAYFRPDNDYKSRRADNLATTLYMDEQRATATPSFMQWLHNHGDSIARASN